MATHQFSIDYFNKKYLDEQFPKQKNTPHFQLAVGQIGLYSNSGGDPNELPSPDCYVITSPRDFPTLALSMLRYLRLQHSLYTYQINLSENASVQIGKVGKKVLEEILTLHNDFVTPRRR